MSVELLARAVETGGVKNVAIVDDAYDPPKGEEISENAFNKFVQLLEDSADVLDELVSACALRRENLEDWEEFREEGALLVRLWGAYVGSGEARNLLEESRRALRLLFEDVHLDRQSKLAQLIPLESLLKDCGVAVARLGSDANPDNVAKLDVVFLDLYLSEDVPAENGPGRKSSIDKARARAISFLQDVRRITDADINAIAPAFVLISSHGSDQKADNFRKRSGQMASRFRFVSKSALRGNEPHSILAIADIFRTCAACSLVEPLQKAWRGILGEASDWVLDKIFDLDIADFGRLYHLTLSEEGASIKDYFKTLVSGALSERVACLFSDVKMTGTQGDAFRGVQHFFEPPSNGFAELFATTRISTDRGDRGERGLDPRSGDLFVEGGLPKGRKATLNGRSLLAVMSPPCDLVSRPDTGIKARSVLLLRGTVRETHRSGAQDGPHMVVVKGRFYEAEWARKSPAAFDIDFIRKNWEEGQYTWVGRLKGEHFLSLQASYLTDLGRIGLPNTPRLYRPLRGAVYFTEGETSSTLLEFTSDDKYAYLCPDRGKPFEKQQLSFSGAFLGAFANLVDTRKGDERLSVRARDKLAAVHTKMDRLLALVELNTAKVHSLQNHMEVELREDAPKDYRGSNLVVSVVVWPD